MKITYLLGAGASANSIPTSKYLSAKIASFLQEISVGKGSLATPGHGVSQGDFDAMITRMIADTSVLLTELQESPNVDVYGRHLFLTGEVLKSRQLKALVSAFLIYYQLENKQDKRYDQFFASILERNDKAEINLPMELLLLSWNYDFQLELAAANYLRLENIDKIQEALNFYPRVQLQDLEREMLNKFSVIKLNGTVGGTLPDDNSYMPLSLSLKPEEGLNADQLRKKRLGEAVLHYNNSSLPNSLLSSDIMYAWEPIMIQKRMKSYLKYKSYNTDVLVYIGYSFPTFNRRFDREMLANMQLLKEVCIQAPAEDIQAINDRLIALLGPERVAGLGKSANPVKIRLIAMDKQRPDEEFYVPFQATTF